MNNLNNTINDLNLLRRDFTNISEITNFSSSLNLNNYLKKIETIYSNAFTNLTNIINYLNDYFESSESVEQLLSDDNNNYENVSEANKIATIEGAIAKLINFKNMTSKQVVKADYIEYANFDGEVNGKYFINNITLDASGKASEKALKAMRQNTLYFQSLIDNAIPGTTIEIPKGEFYFTSGGSVTRNGENIENYVVHINNGNVLLKGAGTDILSGNCTIFKPYSNSGEIEKGLDMFYYNEQKDSSFDNGRYLENFDFSNFIIDSANTRANSYGAGKGFMINLCKDCDWKNVVVKNTDATGFGMDMPINCTITDCVAINCGKNASKDNNGASGFGIGIGYSNEESILVENCLSIGNKKYGFFTEHQNRFSIDDFSATNFNKFVFKNCVSEGNLYNYGGERAIDTFFIDCKSVKNPQTVLDVHFSCESRNSQTINMDIQTEFTDISKNSYAYDAVKWAMGNGLVNKIANTNAKGSCFLDLNKITTNNFEGDKPMTRAEAVDILWRLDGMKGNTPDSGWYQQVKTNFSDVDSSQWYAQGVKWASENGIAGGYSEDYFGVNENVSRGQFITMLWRYAGKPTANGNSMSFTDVGSDKYYYEAIKWASSMGITQGYNTNEFMPDSPISKQQLVTFLYRYQNL